jgi:WD40 repeat protein
MADVFISYLIKDADFANRLHESLKGLNRDIWIDWRSIPVGSQWKGEILAGIEEADNFVFILSPDSVASSMCNEEIAHAAACNKRIFTVLYKPVAKERMPPLLGPIHWIPYHTVGFDQAFQLLIGAIDTDLSLVKMHTRLLNRAKEWERENMDGSFLLRGSDLRQAEQWADQGGDNDKSRPTPLHRQYISASRLSERKRLKVWRFLALLAAIVFALLSVVAWRQRNIATERERQADEAKQQESLARLEAERQRAIAVENANEAIRQQKLALASANEANRQRKNAQERQVEAERQRRIALSRQLAAQADSLFRDDPNLSALLSIESIRRFRFEGNDHSLRRVLPFLQGVSLLATSSNIVFVGKADLTSSGGYLLGSDSSNVRLLDPELRQQFLALDKRLGGLSFEDGFSALKEFQSHWASIVTFSGDGKYIATGGADGLVRVFESETGKKVRILQGAAPVGSVALSSQGQYLGGVYANGEVRLFQLSTGNVRTTFKLQGSSWGTAGFALDDSSFYVFPFGGKSVEVLTPVSGGVMQDLTFDEKVTAAVVMPRSNKMAAIVGTTLKVQTIPAMLEMWHTSESGWEPFRFPLIVSPDGRYLALIGEFRRIQVFDLESGKTIFDLPPLGVGRQGYSRVPTAVFSPDGQYLAVANYDDSLSLVDMKTGKEVGNILDEDIMGIWFPSEFSKPSVMKVDDWRPLRKGLGNVVAFSFSADGPYLMVAYSFWEDGTSRSGKPFLRDNETLVARYTVRSEDLVSEACKRIPRNLTATQWKEYIGDEPYQKTCPDLK